MSAQTQCVCVCVRRRSLAYALYGDVNAAAMRVDMRELNRRAVWNAAECVELFYAAGWWLVFKGRNVHMCEG